MLMDPHINSAQEDEEIESHEHPGTGQTLTPVYLQPTYPSGLLDFVILPGVVLIAFWTLVLNLARVVGW